MNRCINVIVFLNLLCVTSQRECSLAATRLLTKIPLLAQRNIGTCRHINDYSVYITSLLDTCTFTPINSAVNFVECQGECALNLNCLALVFFASNSSCEHCVTGSGSGNGNSCSQSDVMISGVALRNYIDGT